MRRHLVLFSGNYSSTLFAVGSMFLLFDRVGTSEDEKKQSDTTQRTMNQISFLAHPRSKIIVIFIFFFSSSFRSMGEMQMAVFPLESSPFVSSHSLYFSPDLLASSLYSIDNRTLPLLPFTYPWIFPVFIFCLLGILLTIIILFLLTYFSFHQYHDQTVLPNILISFSVGSTYIIAIICLIRGNEFLCGLREFLSQLAYALLFSAFLSEYSIQWLSRQIQSKRMQQYIALLAFSLLVSVQIPIGILWWYFTVPRHCPQQRTTEYPPLRFIFQQQRKPLSAAACANHCTIDYRFYATYTYIIFELVLCTIIAICLFFSRYSQERNKVEKQASIPSYDHQTLSRFLRLVTFVLISLIWSCWSLVYHYTDPFFVFPSLILGMFTIATICLFLILIPQIYFYFKVKSYKIHQRKSLLIQNRFAVAEELKEQATLSPRNNVSYELGTSGTFLPLTRTPRDLFLGTTTNKATSTMDKLDQLIYGEQPSPGLRSDYENRSDIVHRDEQQYPYVNIPLHRQVGSSSVHSVRSLLIVVLSSSHPAASPRIRLVMEIIGRNQPYRHLHRSIVHRILFHTVTRPSFQFYAPPIITQHRHRLKCEYE